MTPKEQEERLSPVAEVAPVTGEESGGRETRLNAATLQNYEGIEGTVPAGFSEKQVRAAIKKVGEDAWRTMGYQRRRRLLESIK